MFETKTIEKIHTTLHEALPSLNLLKDDFFIIGSAALTLSGINAGEISDLDILTSKEDAFKLKSEWKSRHIAYPHTIDNHLFHSEFSRYKFSTLDIEIMGNLKINTQGEWQKLLVKEWTTFNIDYLNIKIPTLNEQKRILNLFGRTKDKERIKLIHINDVDE